MYGELIPVGGGDPIPLFKKSLLVGRRESCDIVLRFPNVSTHHCQLTVTGGYWYVRDLQSRNGTKVNGFRVSDKLVNPGDVLSIAKHKYEVQYSPVDLGAVGPPPAASTTMESEIFSKSLLQRAGLESRQFSSAKKKTTDIDDEPVYDITNDDPGQIRIRPNRR
jgi:pSer/pThr/pTyr-binding forkhead associated (FHA) protein